MFHHIAIEVSELEKSILFYGRWFGFVEEMRLEAGGEKLAFLRQGHIRLELVENKEVSHANSAHHLAFQVDHLTEILSVMKKEGITISEPEMQLENGWRNAFILGPDQEWIELIQFSAAE